MTLTVEQRSALLVLRAIVGGVVTQPGIERGLLAPEDMIARGWVRVYDGRYALTAAGEVWVRHLENREERAG